MSDNKVNIKKPENYSNFFERKSKIENKKMIENNMIRLKKFLQNKTNKRKRRKEVNKKSGSVSSLSNSSHVSSDSSISYGGRKGIMRRKRNGGKTTKRRMKK